MDICFSRVYFESGLRVSDSKGRWGRAQQPSLTNRRQPVWCGPVFP